MTYQEFLKQTEEFIFVEDQPEKADIIFVPGNGYPQMAEKAAELYRKGYGRYILPSGKYSITMGAFSGVLSEKKNIPDNIRQNGNFSGMFSLKMALRQKIFCGRSATYTYENALFSKKVTDEAGFL